MQNDLQSPESIDTHLYIQVGAVIIQADKRPVIRILQTNQTDYPELLDWACSFGFIERACIEGAGTYGSA